MSCGNYSDDITLYYTVPLKTNLSVTSGGITGRSTYSGGNVNALSSGCNSCSSNTNNSNTTALRSVDNNTFSLNQNNNSLTNSNCFRQYRDNKEYITCVDPQTNLKTMTVIDRR